MRYALQCRQLRHEHPDSKYVYSSYLALCKGICCSSFCKLFMISVDDKAIVPVGSPNRPVSTGVKGHNRSLVIGISSNLQALDYVFHVAGIILSLAFSLISQKKPVILFFCLCF